MLWQEGTWLFYDFSALSYKRAVWLKPYFDSAQVVLQDSSLIKILLWHYNRAVWLKSYFDITRQQFD